MIIYSYKLNGSCNICYSIYWMRCYNYSANVFNIICTVFTFCNLFINYLLNMLNQYLVRNIYKTYTKMFYFIVQSMYSLLLYLVMNYIDYSVFTTFMFVTLVPLSVTLIIYYTSCILFDDMNFNIPEILLITVVQITVLTICLWLHTMI